MGDLKIHDISYLPDPCPLPEQIKKRALIEKEKFIYAPFSGIGGIVYDKDAVYIELGGSHSFNKRTLDEETNTIITNLMETKSTLDVKLEEAKIRLFKGGDALTAKDLEENQQKTENIKLYEKRDVEKEEKEDSDLDAELKELRKENFYEEKVEDSGRIRRKVVFDTADTDISINLNSDSEDEEDEDEIKEVISTSFEYTNLRDNKDKDIHAKVSSILKELNSEANIKNDKYKQKSLEVNEESAPEETSNSSEDEINLTDEDGGINNDDDKNDSSNDESFDKEGNLEDKFENDEENMDNKWKENLAQKAKDSFLHHQNSNRNIMKLVYGKLINIFNIFFELYLSKIL